jgi:hypothetical protein
MCLLSCPILLPSLGSAKNTPCHRNRRLIFPEYLHEKTPLNRKRGLPLYFRSLFGLVRVILLVLNCVPDKKLSYNFLMLLYGQERRGSPLCFPSFLPYFQSAKEQIENTTPNRVTEYVCLYLRTNFLYVQEWRGSPLCFPSFLPSHSVKSSKEKYYCLNNYEHEYTSKRHWKTIGPLGGFGCQMPLSWPCGWLLQS